MPPLPQDAGEELEDRRRSRGKPMLAGSLDGEEDCDLVVFHPARTLPTPGGGCLPEITHFPEICFVNNVQTLAGKLDWLKERKDFQKNPVARIATRLLQSQYMPHGEDLYPWILREVRRGNIQLPSEWQEGGAWHKLIEMEMSAEQELARRNALVNDPEWGNNTPKEWWDDDKPIDWENIQTAPWNKLTDTLDAFNNLKDSRYEDVWDAMMSANGGQQLRIPGVVTPEGERGNWYPIKPDQFKDWEKVLEDRARRRKGVDPMQMSAPEFYQQMYNEWLPEWEDQHRQGLGEVMHHFPDKWTIRKIQNEEECQREGDDMGHCLGAYGPEVENRSTHIFSLRDPRNRPHATFEIRPDKHLQGSIPTSEFERVGIDNPTSSMVEDVGFLMRQIQGVATPFSMHDIASPEWIRDLNPEHQNQPWGKLYNLAQNLLQKPPAAPTRGTLVQVQGKENSAPTPEYQDRIKNWFGSMSPEHWPTNLEETSYHPTYSDPPSRYPDAQRQWDEAWNNDPDDPDRHLGRTEEHYPSPAHKGISGEICHCPWGPQRDLWSWSDDAGSLGHEGLRDHQRHARRPDPVDHPVTDDAALTDPRISVGKSQPQRDREIPGETAGGTTRRLRRVDMLASLGDGANTLWTQPEVSKVPVGSLDHRMAAEGTVPPEVGESSILIEEHDKPLHNRVILADSLDYEPPEDFLVPDFEPWALGHDGKGLMNQDGEIITWRTNAMGEPHHDVISAEENFPYVVKLNIYPNGKVFIPSPDELHLFGISREDATNLLEQQKLPSGLVFDPRFTAKTAAQPQVMYHVGMGKWGPDGELVADHEEPPTVLYHRAPKEHRESIETNGLHAAGDPEVDPQPAVFMTRNNPAQVQRDSFGGLYHYEPDQHDVYEVDVRGLPIRYDPWGEGTEAAEKLYGGEGGSFYHSGNIPPERIRRIASVPTCPTCGDPLQGEHDTFCPRCQWSEENAMLDRDPLSNPPDPTVDMHRGIQASVPNHRWMQKWYDAAYDAP